MKEPFDIFTKEYDLWFDTKGKYDYVAEVQGLKRFVRDSGRSVEIGVGTGRFAGVLNIKMGIDPSFNSLLLAKGRVDMLICGKVENLPFKDGSFDQVLVVVSICFFDDVEMASKEIRRITRKGGRLIIGLVPRDTCTGEYYTYLGRKQHRFYQFARFYTNQEVIDIFERVGFRHIDSLHVVRFRKDFKLLKDFRFHVRFSVLSFEAV